MAGGREQETNGHDEVLAARMEEYLGPIRTAFAQAGAAVDPGQAPPGGFDPCAYGCPPPPRGPWPTPPPDDAAPLPGGAEDLAYLPVTALAHLIRTGALSAREAVDAYAARIERLNPRLNAFITPTLDQARAAAERPADGPLGGVPMAIKDIVEVAGTRATGGSALLRDHVAERDAVVWQRLRLAGALLIGKTNTHEFAAGPTGENEAFGPARNPWCTDRITGGSSSGSAAAVAAGLASAAIGTDTGGSIRIPAALCGTVGLKPTYGRVDTRGVYPLSWSLDHVGPLGRTVRDCGRLLDVLALEPHNLCEAAATEGARGDLRGIRVGVLRAWLASGVEPAVADAFEAALDALRALGAEVRDQAVPASAELLMAVNRAITLPEASAWHEPFLAAGRAHEYGGNVRPRMEAGLEVPAVLYLRAQRLRAALAAAFAPTWQEVDLVALPTVPVQAPPIGSAEVTLGVGRTAPTAMALLGWNGPFNVLGNPALSLPCGLTPDGLPVGLQLVAAPGGDAFVCMAGAAVERALGPSPRPPLA